MVRVSVIGTSGSGKSTLAQRLGRSLDLPVIELDALNWEPGWRALSIEDPDAFRARVAEAAAGERWVCAGNYTKAQPGILARATDLVWLDYPRPLVMRRVIWRSLVRALTREELWPGTGNREQFARWLDKEHPIRWAWDTHARRRTTAEALFASLAEGAIRLHRLRTPREADALVELFAREAAAKESAGEGAPPALQKT